MQREVPGREIETSRSDGSRGLFFGIKELLEVHTADHGIELVVAQVLVPYRPIISQLFLLGN